MTLNLRCREGQSYFRLGGHLVTRSYEVAPILTDREPKELIRKHHFQGSYVAARYRYCLYDKGALVGVAVYSYPCNDRVLSSAIPFGDPLESVELGRFVLLDSAPGNSESWFLSRTFELLRREGIIGIVSFSDPVPRRMPDGRLVFKGHIGQIYQALGARYLGLSTARTLRLLPDCKVLSDRGIQKIRKGEKGWRSQARVLEQWGAPPAPEDPEARRDWLRTWMKRATRPLRHPGHYKYVWGLHPSVLRALPAGRKYPKDIIGVDEPTLFDYVLRGGL